MSDDVKGAAKGFKSSAFLVAAVIAILIAGWVMKSGPSAAPERAAAPPPVLAPTLGAPIAPELAPAEPESVDREALPPAPQERQAPAPLPPPETAPPADSMLTKLAMRASADVARLTRAKGRYTAQLLVACKPETVDRLLAASAGSTNLYVLPAQLKDEACFRVCFGSYPTAKDAAAAVDLPKALRGADRVGAVEISKVVP